jgi:hypothetical protein
MSIQFKTLTIAAGDTESGVMELKQGTTCVGIQLPALGTTITYIKVSNNGSVTLPTYQRLWKKDGSAVLSVASGTGAVAWTVKLIRPWRWMKIEVGTSQASDRVFKVSANE